MRYHHRQFNLITLGTVAVGMLFTLVLILSPESIFNKFILFDEIFEAANGSWKIYTVIISGLIFLIVLNFSSLVTEINNKTFRWFFGFGLPFRTIQLKNIKSVTIVKNKWWYGWGIRQVKKGWLYNVAGLDAIEITLDSGKTIRIGTNEVKILANKLEKAVANAVSKRAH